MGDARGYRLAVAIYGTLLAICLLGALLPALAIFRNTAEPGELRYFWGYLGYNLGCLVALLIFRNKLKEPITLAAAWLTVRSQRRARALIGMLAFFLLITFQAKIHWGFWWYSIPGWVMTKSETVVSYAHGEQLPLDTSLDRLVRLSVNQDWIEKASIGNSIQTSGRAMLLHYSDNSVHAANYGLFGLVFPNYILGTSYYEIKDQSLFLRLLRYKLERLRAGGGPFLVPERWSYPSHTQDFPLPYEQYPDPSQLTGVSFWEISLAVHPDKAVEILNATNLFTIDAQEIG
jgi:hypothetical protein